MFKENIINLTTRSLTPFLSYQMTTEMTRREDVEARATCLFSFELLTVTSSIDIFMSKRRKYYKWKTAASLFKVHHHKVLYKSIKYLIKWIMSKQILLVFFLSLFTKNK